MKVKTRVLKRWGATFKVTDILFLRRYVLLLGPFGLSSIEDETKPASSIALRCFATSCWPRPSSFASWRG